MSETSTFPTAYVVTPVRDRRPVRPKGHVSARSVGALTPAVTRAVFEKFGFATAQLVGEWRTIVGDRLAATTAPEQIKWPRRAGAGAVVEMPGEGSGKASARGGATLVVRVEPAVALDVQYKAALIIERVNAWFGYRAVADLRIVQGGVQQPVQQGSNEPPRRSAPKLRAAVQPIDDIADAGLKAALERMQAGIVNRCR